MTKGFTITKDISTEEAGSSAVDLLARESGLSKTLLKEAMTKGAVWLKRGKGRKRLRRATFELRAGDRIELFYDPALLAIVPPAARPLADLGRYSLWYKPPGLLSQGTEYADHCSLLRQAEQQLAREPFLVHRLDREAAGLVLVAHDGKAAALLSQLFAGREVAKRYRVEVLGLLGEPGMEGSITLPLDGKPAVTRYRVAEHEPPGRTRVEVQILTGRLHQIRRHFEAIGHPVMGDPRYGQGNKNSAGLQLVAAELEFDDPFSRTHRLFRLTDFDLGPP